MIKIHMDIYCTSFCNHGHLYDGRPVNHECYVLPRGFIAAEATGDDDKASNLLRAWTTRKIHRGVKRNNG